MRTVRIDRLAGVTGLHWGTGSAVTSVELLTRQFGDAYVDVGGRWGIGIDGCTVENVEVRQSMVSLRIRDDVHTPRTIRLLCGNVTRDRYSLRVNGRNQGTLSAKKLRNGTMVTIP